VVIWAPFTWLTLNIVNPAFEGVFLNPVSRFIGRVIAKALAAPFRFVKSKWSSLSRSQRESINQWAERIVVGFFGLVALFLFGSMLYAGFTDNWKMTLIVIGAVALALVIFVGLCMLASHLAEQHDKVKDARREALRQAWYNLEITDDEYFGRRTKKAPGVVKRFLSGVVDFLVLLAQIIRVKKWKICPLVEIPKN
jgi:uncharacterized membrane protein